MSIKEYIKYIQNIHRLQSAKSVIVKAASKTGSWVEYALIYAPNITYKLTDREVLT